MAQKTNLTPPANVVERNIKMTKKIMQQLLNDPQIFDSLPDRFELIILPEDDPEMRLYNLNLLDKYGSENKPVVFARVKVRKEKVEMQDRFNLYAPVPLAV